MAWLKLNWWVIIVIFILLQTPLTAEEFATFESFYVESSTVGWILSAILAVVAGLAIFFTGGAASPIVVSIGSWVGSLAGLSGIAATNYGLALIGFGSVATGGLGIVGGVAILTAALTFSTEVVIDYTLTTAINTYSHRKFVEDSKKMLTLPIPRNEDGSSEYENTVEYLKEHIDSEKPLFTDVNQEVLENAFERFEIVTDDREKHIKDLVLRSYLYFARNHYEKAKEDAQDAIALARGEKIRRTLPAFIYSVSSLYEKQFDYAKITSNYFRYSVLAEPDNELIPLMFAIYLDRVLYRMNDDTNLDHQSLDTIKQIAFELKDKDLKAQALVITLMRYFMRIKIEQQRILALAESENDNIKNSSKTLKIVKDAFNEYKALLLSVRPILVTKVVEEAIKENNEMKNLPIVYGKYEESTHYLEKIVQDLQAYQEQLRTEGVKLNRGKILKSIDNIYIILILIGIFLLLIILIGKRWFIGRKN